MMQGWREARAGHPRRLIVKLLPWVIFVAVGIWLNSNTEQAADKAANAAQASHHAAVQAQETAEQVKHLTVSLQNIITSACEVNGNALREVIREGIKEDITDPDDPRLRELLPDASPQRIREIVEEGNAKKMERLAKAHDVDCAAVYKQFKLPSP